MSSSGREKVLYIRAIDPAGMDLLKEKYDVIVAEDQSRETILKYIGDMSAVVTGLAVIDKEIIDAGRDLKVIAKHGAGTDNIDVKAAAEKGITVVTTGDANVQSVAEHVITAMGALAKRVSWFDAQMRQGNWDSRNTEGSVDLFGKKLGVIGYGNLGQAVSRIARNGFRMDVTVYARKNHCGEIQMAGLRYEDDLDRLCREMDFISLHVPLTEETRDLIDERRLHLMKPSAYLINFARGGIVNEPALYQALSEHRIAGAALDVYESEPQAPDVQLLQELNNVLLSPHVAWATADARRKMSLQVAEGVDDVLSGRSPRFAADIK